MITWYMSGNTTLQFTQYLIDVFAGDGKAKLALLIYSHIHIVVDPTQQRGFE